MALQNFQATAQGGEEIFECNGEDDDQRIFTEERAIDRLTNYRESVRAKADSQSEQNGMITTQSLSPADAFEIFQGLQRPSPFQEEQNSLTLLIFVE